jgi:Polyketide cyclase / dehydrase and lipid transport
LPSWHPVVADSMIEDGRPGDAVGSIRKITTRADDGQTLREKLLSLSDHDRSVSFDFQTAPFPVRNYYSTLRVIPITDGDRSFIEWWATFDCDEAREAEMVRTFVQGVYQPGFEALKQHFAG